MSITLSVINNKGGVGKTTSTACLGELLAFLGKKVLLIDMDPQGNLSMIYGGYYDDSNDGSEPTHKNIADLFLHRYQSAEDVNSVIYPTRIDNLFLLPATHRHVHTPDVLSRKTTANNFIVLKRALDKIKEEYDYILIDNAPANNIMTVNSLMSSDLVISPIRTEGFSYEGLVNTMQTILEIKEDHCIDNLEFRGAFFVQVNPKTNVYKVLKENYQNELKDKLLPTAIRSDIKISECETNLVSFLDYASSSNAMLDYCHLLLDLNILDVPTANALKQGMNF